MEYGPPIDLSFKGLFMVAEATLSDPRLGLRPLRTDSHNKYRTRALRLNNNNIEDLSGLEFTLNHFLVEPSMLGWLDLSFNKMTGIDDVLCQLNELRILYLHGNNIRYLNEVNKLSKLTHLHNLTLHGNAIDKHKGYSGVSDTNSDEGLGRFNVSVVPAKPWSILVERFDKKVMSYQEREARNHVVSVLPHLKRLDFSAVTKQERVLAKDSSTSLKLYKKHKSNAQTDD